MPPKKKKGSGKKGKGKGKGAKQVPPNQVPKLDEETKEFFLVQIRDLESRLQRYRKEDLWIYVVIKNDCFLYVVNKPYFSIFCE